MKTFRNTFTALFLSFGLFLSLTQALPVSAHELLPKSVLEYLQDNPNATPEEIQAYAQTQSSEIADQFRDKEQVTDLLAKRNTNFFDNFVDFAKLGVEHILAGLDHILFVVTLVLVFVSIRELLKLTATFTMAHSIALLLAGAGIITLPSSIVEPIIAVSILYVAIASVYFKDAKFVKNNTYKILMVFIFGLFHGLGFAGLLQEIQIPSSNFVSSLLAFNVGIELGQIIILAIILPPIFYFKERAWYPKAIKVIAGVISIAAVYWIIQRVFFA